MRHYQVKTRPAHAMAVKHVILQRIMNCLHMLCDKNGVKAVSHHNFFTHCHIHFSINNPV